MSDLNPVEKSRAKQRTAPPTVPPPPKLNPDFPYRPEVFPIGEFPELLRRVDTPSQKV